MREYHLGSVLLVILEAFMCGSLLVLAAVDSRIGHPEDVTYDAVLSALNAFAMFTWLLAFGRTRSHA